MIQLSLREEQWTLRNPFRISRGVKTAANVIVVELRDELTGAVGRGEGVPYARYDESPASVRSQIESLQSRLAAGLSRRSLLECLPAGAARNAIDCALWDLEAKVTGRSVRQTLPDQKEHVVTTALTIGLDSALAMAETARSLKSPPLIKVKVDARDPAAQILAVRDACPTSQMIVDPNESWTLDILRDLQSVLSANAVALVEQPLPAGADSELNSFKSAVPLCADESCHTAADLEELAGRYQYINIKLDKTGGLTAALDLLWQASAAKFGIMVGCMICTSLSIAPTLLVARKARFVDVDGPLWLIQDRAGGIALNNHRLTEPEAGFWGDPYRQDHDV